MRLWSVHPRYLDAQGLVALWREGLLAQKVLEGKTKGYKYHPQLYRFQKTKKPISFISKYLHFVANEADERGYKFDRKKINSSAKNKTKMISVTRGQIEYETKHLLSKLKKRNPKLYKLIEKVKRLPPHPLFKVVAGQIHSWEKIY